MLQLPGGHVVPDHKVLFVFRNLGQVAIKLDQSGRQGAAFLPLPVGHGGHRSGHGSITRDHIHGSVLFGPINLGGGGGIFAATWRQSRINLDFFHSEVNGSKFNFTLATRNEGMYQDNVK